MVTRGTVIVFCAAILAAMAASIWLVVRENSRDAVLKRKPLQKQDDDGVIVDVKYNKNYPFLFDKRGRFIKKRPTLEVVDPAEMDQAKEEAPEKAPSEAEPVKVGEKAM
ncbi:conserved hypothetical protein [Neospora caninum Liverpool]|uniref:Transmembrane protein n=1 Tax=Neospora caninum (strain Liverpool) TaxID=572307 RepID=F0VI51_NEOCL|nr:conserved hypothetical protein [Neospora caninum Liverpool]CBZ53412.1 conserved hypothetical protein [Neospora caninum Liverpool]CEL67399.1 TPA: hypothetical protein BN1204_031990 [Neospora caninum Liverpool]|eukprot:XP_003883444.1 conserved hypothetical protein [Neospora caninum Liverpool]